MGKTWFKAGSLAFAFCGILLAVQEVAQAGPVRWRCDFEAALAEAKQQNKPVLLEISASWCHFCHKMQDKTFSNSAVADQINCYFIPVLVDADQNRDILNWAGIRNLPATVIVAPDRTIMERIVGFKQPRMMTAALTPHQCALPAVTPETAPDEALAKSEEPKAPASLPSDLGKAEAQPKQEVAAKTPAADGVAFASASEEMAADLQRETRRLAYNGYCPVLIFEEQLLTEGKPDLLVVHDGVEYRFITEANRDKFIANPTKYLPANNGRCVVDGNSEGNPDTATVYDGKIWLFKDAANQDIFCNNPDPYLITH